MQAALAPRPTKAAPIGNLRAILARQGFRRLLAVRLTSQLGDGWFQAGLAGSVFFSPERATSPVAIAVAFAVLLVPYSALGPFVGVFLDRWNRRQVLFVANAMRAGLVIPASWLVWRADDGVAFIVLALCIIALNRFFLAGLSASQPHVTDEDRLVTANSFATTLGSVSYSGGLALAAAAFHVTGTTSHVYAIVAVAALLAYGGSAALTLVSFQLTELGPDDANLAHDSIWGAVTETAAGMLAGLRHLAARPAAANIVVVQTVNRGLYGVLVVSTLLLYRDYYHADNAAASMAGLFPVAVAAAVGALIAAVITPPITRRFGARTWTVAMIAGLAVLLPLLGAPFRAPLTVAAAGVLSLATQGLKIVSDTALQVECHDEYRGRVFSVSDTTINLLFVVGLFVGALLLPADGRGTTALLGVGAGYAMLASWYAFIAAPRAATTAARRTPATEPAGSPVE